MNPRSLLSKPGDLKPTFDSKRTRSPEILRNARNPDWPLSDGPRRIEFDVRRVRTLKAVDVVLLQPGDGRLGAVDASSRRSSRRWRSACAAAAVPVDAAGVRGVGEDAHRAALVADVAVRRRHHDADRRLVGELAAGAADGVAGERLDGLRRLQRPDRDGGLLLPRSSR